MFSIVSEQFPHKIRPRKLKKLAEQSREWMIFMDGAALDFNSLACPRARSLSISRGKEEGLLSVTRSALIACTSGREGGSKGEEVSGRKRVFVEVGEAAQGARRRAVPKELHRREGRRRRAAPALCPERLEMRLRTRTKNPLPQISHLSVKSHSGIAPDSSFQPRALSVKTVFRAVGQGLNQCAVDYADARV